MSSTYKEAPELPRAPTVIRSSLQDQYPSSTLSDSSGRPNVQPSSETSTYAHASTSSPGIPSSPTQLSAKPPYASRPPPPPRFPSLSDVGLAPSAVTSTTKDPQAKQVSQHLTLVQNEVDTSTISASSVQTYPVASISAVPSYPTTARQRYPHASVQQPSRHAQHGHSDEVYSEEDVVKGGERDSNFAQLSRSKFDAPPSSQKAHAPTLVPASNQSKLGNRASSKTQSSSSQRRTQKSVSSLSSQSAKYSTPGFMKKLLSQLKQRLKKPDSVTTGPSGRPGSKPFLSKAKESVYKLPDPTLLFMLFLVVILLIFDKRPDLLRTWAARIIIPLTLVPTVAISAVWRRTRVTPAKPEHSIVSVAAPFPNASLLVTKGEKLRQREAALVEAEAELHASQLKLEVMRKKIESRLPPDITVHLDHTKGALPPQLSNRVPSQSSPSAS